MPTPRSISYDYAADADKLAALLRDQEFLRARCEALGERNVEVRVQEEHEAFHVVVARDRDVSVPGFASKFVRPVSRVVDRQQWRREGDRWLVDYTIEIGSAPSTITGRTTFIPTPQGCHYETTFEVTARVPLIASKLESLVADRVEASLRANAERNAQVLAG